MGSDPGPEGNAPPMLVIGSPEQSSCDDIQIPASVNLIIDVNLTSIESGYRRWIMFRRSIDCVLVAAILMTMALAEGEQYAVDISPEGYLIAGDKMTLYYSLNDAPGNGISNCIGDCSLLWPPFYADLILVPSGLSTSDFTTISRTDGKMQTAYKGWPLYKYTEDKKPGDVNGDKVNSIWFVIYPTKFPPK